ncbi:SDR family NAD(P)-dependent oxidoreductase [Membranihabitans maritimus]|uniref:SDR family NAD(P)-dependent oxidoreductase n=1 Tax=Membranihabitans maritimus TaxID=2904244 RepID=UPI001F1A3EAE|nr:SDR family NAD(P)-dependent oxidoreductase [Membranihabitans maritimus]
MRLKNKVIIITGSTTGIGKAIAQRCVTEGAKVIVHGREKKAGENVIKEIGEENGILHLDDLTDPLSAERLVNAAINSYGTLDAIVNNAAWVPASDIHNTDLKLLEDVFSVNTFAPYLLIKSALPHLTESKGSVLNIGSVNAWSGEPNLLAYSMSKGAMMTMTRNLGDALFREAGVRVNQINPGWVLTEKEIERKRSQNLPYDWYTYLPKEFAPSGRIIWSKEIAAAVIYWLSEESGPITGQTVELEQYPLLGRNAPKDEVTIPARGNDESPKT